MELNYKYKKIVNPLLLADCYKDSHMAMYKPGTTRVYSTWTPRSSEHSHNDPFVVVFGIQAALYDLKNKWNEGFFSRDVAVCYAEFAEQWQANYGAEPPQAWRDNIYALHNLGYLPLEIKALPEGTKCPIRTPYLDIVNTDDRFFWLTNFIETDLSSQLWLPATSATRAYFNRLLVNEGARLTGIPEDAMNFTNHDFSYRGMSNTLAAMASGAAHLLSSYGTDTKPATAYIEAVYGDKAGREYTAGSVPASEHSTMCSWGKADELELFNWLATEIYPSGFLSVVSDTWDLWSVIGEYLPKLKDKIMARDGRLVVRPDSGNPVLILCGDETSDNPIIRKGVIESLWDIFGGTYTTGADGEQYKTLDTHIGAIYGDAINYERCREILNRLRDKGFSAANAVFGWGSYTYQLQTRDSYGMALKSTWVVNNGEEIAIYKDPKTDSGMKKSQKGLLVVNPDLTYTDGLTLAEQREKSNMLIPRFVNGEIVNDDTFANIRKRLWEVQDVQN